MRNKIMAFVILIICSNLVLATNESNQSQNVKLEIILPQNITMGLVYDSLFKITNLNYVKGVDSKINVTINYNITQLDTLIYSANFSRIVNAFSTSATGFLFLDSPGSYVLCGQVENFSSCKQLTVIDPNQITCDVNLSISIDKNIFDNHERFEIKNQISFEKDKEYPYIIEYWIEDLFGTEIKKKINTTNDNDKTFTPDIDEKSAVYLLKNKLVYVGCNNTIGKIEDGVMFAVRNQEYQEVSLKTTENTDSNNINNNTDVFDAEIYSFYTRSKKYKPEINIYANLKGSGEATVIFSSSKKEQIRKLELPAKPVFLGEAEPGSNYYTLELYINGDLADSRSLTINLEGEISKPKINTTKNSTKIVQTKKPINIPKPIIQEKKTEARTIVAIPKEDIKDEVRIEEEPMQKVFNSDSQIKKNAAPTIGIGVLILIAIGVVLFKK